MKFKGISFCVFPSSLIIVRRQWRIERGVELGNLFYGNISSFNSLKNGKLYFN